MSDVIFYYYPEEIFKSSTSSTIYLLIALIKKVIIEMNTSQSVYKIWDRYFTWNSIISCILFNGVNSFFRFQRKIIQDIEFLIYNKKPFETKYETNLLWYVIITIIFSSSSKTWKHDVHKYLRDPNSRNIINGGIIKWFNLHR